MATRLDPEVGKAAVIKKQKLQEVGGPSTAHSPSIPQRASALRLLSFCAILVLISIIGLVVRWQQLQEWGIAHQPASELRQAALSDRADPLTLYVYATKQVDQGDAETAVAALDRAASKLDPDDKTSVAQRVCSLAGYLHARRGEPQKAVPLLRRAQSLDSNDPMPYLAFGILLDAQNSARFAVTQFQVVTQLDPNNVEAWFRLGRAYNEDYKAHQAIDPLKNAVRLAPNDAASHAELGTSYSLRSEFQLAAEEFKRAVALKPDNIYYQAALANVTAYSARTESQYREAARSLEDLTRKLPNISGLEFTLGLLHLRFNNVSEARNRFSSYLKTHPKDAEAWYNLSVAEMRLGNNAAFEAARKKHQQIADLRTQVSDSEKRVGSRASDPELRIQLARAYEHVGNWLGAYWQSNTAARLVPANPTYKDFEKEMLQKHPEIRAAGTDTSVVGKDQTTGPPPPPELIDIPINSAYGAASGPK